ncbi:MAG: hypothetical protein ACE5NN_03865 [Candidatus Bathyarchaeia archaeon]
MAKAVVYYSRFTHLPETVEIGETQDLLMVMRRWNLIDRIRSQWRWTILLRASCPIRLKS